MRARDSGPPNAAESFAPEPSFGWLWSLALAVLSLLGLAAVLIASVVDPDPEPVPVWAWVLTAGITVPLGVMFIAIAAFFPRMRYEFDERELVVRYGPLLTWRIPYAEITEIELRDLKSSPWSSSMRWPGLALWGVYYSGDRTIRMCSTRANRGVTVITTAARRYGVSPRERERFEDTLRARMHAAGE